MRKKMNLCMGAGRYFCAERLGIIQRFSFSLQFISYIIIDFMCLHFGLVATNVMGKISLAKHFVFTSVGQDQKCSLSLSQ